MLICAQRLRRACSLILKISWIQCIRSFLSALLRSGALFEMKSRRGIFCFAHEKSSGADLRFIDQASSDKFIPHVIEPTFGLGRTILAVLLSSYAEDELGGEKRIFLRLKPAIAPVTVAIFPLVKNKPDLVAKAREIYSSLNQCAKSVQFDDNGNIGKRYRRQDEIGTPWCVTVDYQTLEDGPLPTPDRGT